MFRVAVRRKEGKSGNTLIRSSAGRCPFSLVTGRVYRIVLPYSLTEHSNPDSLRLQPVMPWKVLLRTSITSHA